VNKALTVLAVDDEAPALDELVYLLGRHPDIGRVYRAGDSTSALRELNRHTIDGIFLDTTCRACPASSSPACLLTSRSDPLSCS
jgi:DNA-binding NarL/FixJ family response regulator